MPLLYLMIAPVAKLTDVQTETGYDLSNGSPVRTLADPTPRPITHRVRNGTVSSSTVRAILDAHILNPSANANLAGVLAAKYNVPTEPSPYNQILEDNELTLMENDEVSP